MRTEIGVFQLNTFQNQDYLCKHKNHMNGTEDMGSVGLDSALVPLQQIQLATIILGTSWNENIILGSVIFIAVSNMSLAHFFF